MDKYNYYNKIGLLPCAGISSRLSNIPKFMLPLKDSKSCLILEWINKLINIGCDKIIIPCSDITIQFIKNIIGIDNEKIEIINVNLTHTMNETIIKSLKNYKYNILIMAMPDTIVDNISDNLIERIISNNNINVGVYLWNIRCSQKGKIGQCQIDNNYITDISDKDINCDYNYGWGVIVWKQIFEKYILNEDQHPGFSLYNSLKESNKIIYELCHGQYFDCGTITGYSEYLTYLENKIPIYIKGTIIIFAIYVNDNIDNENCIIQCLEQCRKIYPYETILAINNNSLKTNWIDCVKKYNIIIINNESENYRYEIGAYKLALSHFRADEYIFLQGSSFLTKKIPKILNNDIPNAIQFQHFNSYDNIEQHKYVNIIFQLITKINNFNINSINGVFGCNFYCNNKFINKLFSIGFFDLPSNIKFHSCAFERLLGGLIMIYGKTDYKSLDGENEFIIDKKLPPPENYTRILYKIWLRM